jgi:hypothetical protein
MTIGNKVLLCLISCLMGGEWNGSGKQGEEQEGDKQSLDG